MSNVYDYDDDSIAQLISDLLKNVTHLEVIDAYGRSYVNFNITDFKFQLQDNLTTLRIYIGEGHDK